MSAIELTMNFLQQAQNPAAGSALLLSVGGADESIAMLAAIALVNRPEPRLHLELLKQLERFRGDLRSFVKRCAGNFEPILRQGLQRAESEYRGPALRLTRVMREIAVLPVLLSQLEVPQLADRAEVLDVLRELLDHVYESTLPRPLDNWSTVPRDRVRLLESVATALDQAVAAPKSQHAELLVEALLALLPREHAILKKLLKQHAHPANELAEQLLMTSTHPGVLLQLTSQLEETYPHPRVMQVFQSRTDPEFLSHWLRNLPRKLSTTLGFNLARFTQIAALRADCLYIIGVPAGLTPRLIALAQASSISAEEKQQVFEWVLKHGDLTGRELAGKILSNRSDEAVRGIVLEGLHSEEAQVQAWATSQLRQRGIPQAFEMLVERLDSPLPEVRAAARAELGDFSVKRFLDLVDELDQTTCISAAQLMLKIDPQAIPKLTQELVHPMRSKRLRAADAVMKARLSPELIQPLSTFLEDPDPALRRKGIQVLSQVTNWEVWNILSRKTGDTNPRVRAEIEAAVADMHARLSPETSATGHAISEAYPE